MGLVGDSNELSLAELIQAKGASRGTCRVQVRGRSGEGVLHLSGGAVVHARYGGASGEAAALALLAEEAVSYRSTSDAVLPPPNMHADHRSLLLEAALNADHARRAAPSTALEIRRRPPPPPAPAPETPPARSRRLAAATAWGLVLLAAGALAIGGTVSFRRSEASATVHPGSAAADRQAPPPPPADAVEASALTGAEDAPPVLVGGDPPRSPVPDVPLRPTIVVRLLVDERGGVARAEVYQHRPDLSAFEMAALTAAQRFRFRPASRNGAPVAAWLSWPVDFI